VRGSDLDDRETLNLGCGRRYDVEAVNLDITRATNPDVVHDLEQTPWPFPDGRGGRIHIVVPHFSSVNAYTDLTHRGFFGWHSFDYLTGEHDHDYYTAVRFRTVRRRLWFEGPVNRRVVQRLAERWPDRYEQRWAWILPAWFLDIELEAIKPD
jgi:hypothetical protein